MPSPDTKPTIHILAYNNVAFTNQTLEACKQWSEGHEVIVWDNGSTQENIDRLDSVVTVFLNPDQGWHRNQKLGRAKNAQIQHGSDWILQTDNDAYLRGDWWTRMQRYIEVFPEVRAWGFYLCGNHKVVKTETREELTIRYPSLLSGLAVLVHCPTAKKHGIAWPEAPVNYRDHPHWADMGHFDGIDVDFQSQFIKAGYEVAIPEEDFAVHLEQPGRSVGYK